MPGSIYAGILGLTDEIFDSLAALVNIAAAHAQLAVLYISFSATRSVDLDSILLRRYLRHLHHLCRPILLRRPSPQHNFVLYENRLEEVIAR